MPPSCPDLPPALPHLRVGASSCFLSLIAYRLSLRKDLIAYRLSLREGLIAYRVLLLHKMKMSKQTLKVYINDGDSYLEFTKQDLMIIHEITNDKTPCIISYRTPAAYGTRSMLAVRFVQINDDVGKDFLERVFDILFNDLCMISPFLLSISYEATNNMLFMFTLCEFLVSKRFPLLTRLHIPTLVVTCYPGKLRQVLEYQTISTLEIKANEASSFSGYVESIRSDALVSVLENSSVESLFFTEESEWSCAFLLFVGQSARCPRLKSITREAPNASKTMSMPWAPVENLKEFVLLPNSNVTSLSLHITQNITPEQENVIGRIIQGLLKLRSVKLTIESRVNIDSRVFVNFFRGHQTLRSAEIHRQGFAQFTSYQKLCDLNTHRNTRVLSAMASPYSVKRLKRDNSMLTKMLPLDIIRSVGKYLDRIPDKPT